MRKISMRCTLFCLLLMFPRVHIIFGVFEVSTTIDVTEYFLNFRSLTDLKLKIKNLRHVPDGKVDET